MANKRHTETEVLGNVRMLCIRHNIWYKELADIMGLSLSTVYARMNNPADFRVGELERLARWSTRKGVPLTVSDLCGKAV